MTRPTSSRTSTLSRAPGSSFGRDYERIRPDSPPFLRIDAPPRERTPSALASIEGLLINAAQFKEQAGRDQLREGVKAAAVDITEGRELNTSRPGEDPGFFGRLTGQDRFVEGYDQAAGLSLAAQYTVAAEQLLLEKGGQLTPAEFEQHLAMTLAGFADQALSDDQKAALGSSILEYNESVKGRHAAAAFSKATTLKMDHITTAWDNTIESLLLGSIPLNADGTRPTWAEVQADPELLERVNANISLNRDGFATALREMATNARRSNPELKDYITPQLHGVVGHYADLLGNPDLLAWAQLKDPDGISADSTAYGISQIKPHLAQLTAASSRRVAVAEQAQERMVEQQLRTDKLSVYDGIVDVRQQAMTRLAEATTPQERQLVLQDLHRQALELGRQIAAMPSLKTNPELRLKMREMTLDILQEAVTGADVVDQEILQRESNVWVAEAITNGIDDDTWTMLTEGTGLLFRMGARDRSLIEAAYREQTAAGQDPDMRNAQALFKTQDAAVKQQYQAYLGSVSQQLPEDLFNAGMEQQLFAADLTALYRKAHEEFYSQDENTTKTRISPYPTQEELNGVFKGARERIDLYKSLATERDEEVSRVPAGPQRNQQLMAIQNLVSSTRQSIGTLQIEGSLASLDERQRDALDSYIGLYLDSDEERLNFINNLPISDQERRSYYNDILQWRDQFNAEAIVLDEEPTEQDRPLVSDDLRRDPVIPILTDRSYQQLATAAFNESPRIRGVLQRAEGMSAQSGLIFVDDAADLAGPLLNEEIVIPLLRAGVTRTNDVRVREAVRELDAVLDSKVYGHQVPPSMRAELERTKMRIQRAVRVSRILELLPPADRQAFVDLDVRLDRLGTPGAEANAAINKFFEERGITDAMIQEHLKTYSDN